MLRSVEDLVLHVIPAGGSPRFFGHNPRASDCGYHDKSTVFNSATLLLILMLLALAGGCARSRPASQRDPIPNVPWVDSTTALRTLAERGRSVKAVQSESVVTITQSRGQSVRLDGAVVLAPPDRARLRAWKLGQAVFDLTLTPDGLWIHMASEPGQKEERPPFPENTTRLVRQWVSLITSFFEQEGLVVEETRDRLQVRKTLDDRSVVACLVDRATLTPRTYTVTDASGKKRLNLALSQYRQINGVVWPTVLKAVSEQGTVLVEMRDVEMNGRIPPKAFVPPRRAEKLP